MCPPKVNESSTRLTTSNHPVIPDIHRNLRTGDLRKQRARHGGAFGEGFGGPELGVEDGVGVPDVDADLPRGELKGGDAAELREGGLGARVGGGAGGFEVAAADEDDAAIDAFFDEVDDFIHQLLMVGEVDHEGAVPIGLRHDVKRVVLREDAGVADDDLDAAELTHGEIDGVLDGLRRDS
jgi:hypothetical protein